MEKAADRLKVLAKIEEFEKAEKWDCDVEDDPEAKELLPDEIDYLNKKLSSKIKCKIANFFGTRFFEKLIKQNILRIKEVRGIENFNAVKCGTIITCNHFSVADNYIVECYRMYFFNTIFFRIIYLKLFGTAVWCAIFSILLNAIRKKYLFPQSPPRIQIIIRCIYPHLITMSDIFFLYYT